MRQTPDRQCPHPTPTPPGRDSVGRGCSRQAGEWPVAPGPSPAAGGGSQLLCAALPWTPRWSTQGPQEAGAASPVWRQEDRWPWACAAGPASSAHGLCTQLFVLSQAGAGLLQFCRAGRGPQSAGAPGYGSTVALRFGFGTWARLCPGAEQRQRKQGDGAGDPASREEPREAGKGGCWGCLGTEPHPIPLWRGGHAHGGAWVGGCHGACLRASG